MPSKWGPNRHETDLWFDYVVLCFVLISLSIPRLATDFYWRRSAFIFVFSVFRSNLLCLFRYVPYLYCCVSIFVSVYMELCLKPLLPICLCCCLPFFILVIDVCIPPYLTYFSGSAFPLFGDCLSSFLDVRMHVSITLFVLCFIPFCDSSFMDLVCLVVFVQRSSVFSLLVVLFRQVALY